MRLTRADLPDGGLRGIDLVGREARLIVLFWQGALRAYLDRCPHYDFQTGMAWKRDAYFDGGRRHLACHAHGAKFDIATGACLSGPCLGQSLIAVPVRVEDGWIVLDGPLPDSV